MEEADHKQLFGNIQIILKSVHSLKKDVIL